MSDFWDREVIEKQHMPWMAIPDVHVRLNSLTGNGELRRAIEWFSAFCAGARSMVR